jgi:hypothetical protein
VARSLYQKSLIERGVSMCDLEISKWGIRLSKSDVPRKMYI